MTFLRKVVQLCIDFIVTAVEFAEILVGSRMPNFLGLTSTKPASYRAILKHVFSYAIDAACTETKHLCISHTCRNVSVVRHTS